MIGIAQTHQCKMSLQKISQIPAGELSGMQAVREVAENSATSVILRVTVAVPLLLASSVAL